MVSKFNSKTRHFTLGILATGLILFFCTQKEPVGPSNSYLNGLPIISDAAAIPSQIIPGATSQIRIRLVDQNGDPISDQSVQFRTSRGQLEYTTGITDKNGWAGTVFASDSTTGIATITATYNNVVRSIYVSITSTGTGALQIASKKLSLYANGQDTTSILISMVSDSVATVAGESVQLETTFGTITPVVRMSASGTARALLTADTSITDISGIITATLGTQTSMAAILFKGLEMEVRTFEDTLFADGQSQALIRVLIRETSSQYLIQNAVVQFHNLNSLGSILPQMTASSGVVDNYFTAGKSPGTANIAVTYGSFSPRRVNFVLKASVYPFRIEPESRFLLANGEQTTLIRITVKNQYNLPAANMAVDLQAKNIGRVETPLITDINGVAEAALYGDTSSVNRYSVLYVTVAGETKKDSVLFKGVHFDVEAKPNYILADGQSVSTITAYLKETTSHIPIVNQRVQFGTTAGSIENEHTTTITGSASAILTSTETPQTATVYVYYGNRFIKSTYVTFGYQNPPNLVLSSLTASKARILADGQDKTAISALVMNAFSQPIKGATVMFSADQEGLIIPEYAITDAAGVAQIELISTVSETADLPVRISAKLYEESVPKQVLVTFEAVTMTLYAFPSRILADGQALSSVTAELKRRQSNAVISNATIRFSADAGTLISESAATSAEGKAVVSLRSELLPQGMVTKTAQITAFYGSSITKETEVVFEKSVPISLTLSANPTALFADGGISSSALTARVVDSYNKPIGETEVEFFFLNKPVNEDWGTLSSTSAITGSNGEAKITLNTGVTVTHVTVMARVRDYPELTETVQVAYELGPVSRVFISAVKTAIRGDGKDQTEITAIVEDAYSHGLNDRTVYFTPSMGDMRFEVKTQRLDVNGTTRDGVAKVTFTSKVVGLSTILGQVKIDPAKELSPANTVTGTISIEVLPGLAYQVEITYAPHDIWIKDSGKRQTLSIYTAIQDEKGNPVADETAVRFRIYSTMGGGDELYPMDPSFSFGGHSDYSESIPTRGGVAQIVYKSGTKAGVVRIQADVFSTQGALLARGISSEILVASGPPFIQDITDLSTTHLTLLPTRMNIWAGLDTTLLSVMVGDRYNNPVQEGTAVYFTTSGGVVTTVAYTNASGLANAILYAGNPQPVINNFYNYTGMGDPNYARYPSEIGQAALDGFYYYEAYDRYMLPNFEQLPGEGTGQYPAITGGKVLNSEGGYEENDGIARIIAYTEGVDLNNRPVRSWDWTAVSYSTAVNYADDYIIWNNTVLGIGEYQPIEFTLLDQLGNPVRSATSITAATIPDNVQASLNWYERSTGNGMGTGVYYVTVSNAVDIQKPKVGPVHLQITVENPYQNSVFTSRGIIYIDSTYAVP